MRQKPGSHQDSNPEHIWLGLLVLCHWARCMTWQLANHQSTLTIDPSYMYTHSFRLFFRQILEWKPWIWGYPRCLRPRLHYPCFHHALITQSSVPKLEKMRNTKSLTNWVAMYSWVHAAVIRVGKYETLDISSSTGSQSTGYSSSCLWPFSAINKQTNKQNKHKQKQAIHYSFMLTPQSENINYCSSRTVKQNWKL